MKRQIDAELLTAPELGAKYRVTSQTVLQWYHEGTIPAVVAVGKIYRFDPAAVERALQRHAAEKRGHRVPEYAEVV